MTAALSHAAPALTTLDSIDDAVALARSIRIHEVGAPVGHAIDSLALFLGGRLLPALRRDEDQINEILTALGHNRAIMIANWLGRHVDDYPTYLFWERIEDEQRLARRAELLNYL